MEPIKPKNFKRFEMAKPMVSSKPTEPAEPVPTTFKETNATTNEPYFNKALTGTGLQLSGNFSKEQKAIADKYSSFFKSPVAIEVLKSHDQFKPSNNVPTKDIMGMVSYFPDSSRILQIRGDLKPDEFTAVMFHEIGHEIFHYDEASSWDYAHKMMNLNIQ